MLDGKYSFQSETKRIFNKTPESVLMLCQYVFYVLPCVSNILILDVLRLLSAIGASKRDCLVLLAR
jgi:hypothetical protein